MKYSQAEQQVRLKYEVESESTEKSRKKALNCNAYLWQDAVDFFV